MTVSHVQHLDPPEQLLPAMFNISSFKSIVDIGSLRSSLIVPRGDINTTTLSIDTTQLDMIGITDVVGNMIVFAVGLERLAPTAYINASVLAESLDNAYKLLFALAVNSVLAPTGSPTCSPTEESLGTVEGETNGVTINRTLAIILEIVLGLIGLMTFILLLISWNRRIELSEDVDSLTSVLKLAGGEPGISPTINMLSKGCNDIHMNLSKGRLHAKSHNGSQPCPIVRSRIEKHPVDHIAKMSHPYAMRLTTGAIFMVTLLLALAIVITLWLCIQARDGLPIPSRNPLLTQLTLNYLPVAFATLLEPFWTFLNRKLCVLKPFEELRSGEAKASQSMDVKYASLPPQLVFWRALKARHFLMVAVCGIGLSTNFLAVALNALLETRVTDVESDATFKTTLSPIVNQFPAEQSSSDHLYIASANFSHHAPLPPWVTPHFFFLPFQTNTTSSLGNVQSYKAMTTGFGLDIECTALDFENPAYIVEAQPEISLNVSNVVCGRSWDIPYNSRAEAKAALEILAPLRPNYENTTQEENVICGSVLAMGFMRAELNAGTEGVDVLFTSSQWVTCQSTIVTAPYLVEVDQSGRVLHFVRQADSLTNATLAPNNSLPSVLSNLFLAFGVPMDQAPSWKNDTYEEWWPGFLIKALTQSTKFVDPSLPAPSFEEVAPVVEDLLKRLFPIILSLRPSAFPPAPPNSTVKGTMLVPTRRVFMSSSMFILTVTLLVMNIAVALAYYICRPRPMPIGLGETIASVLALFHGSGLINEQPRDDKPWPKEWAFGYGNFIGVDGKPRTGIERKPFVVPLDGKKGI